MKRILVPLLIVFPCLLLTVLYGFSIHTVRGNSMLPIYTAGTLVVSCKFMYGLPLPFSTGFLILWKRPGPGDIIVFKHPDTGEKLIKRCIAGPGDRITFSGSIMNVNLHEIALTPSQLDRLRKYSSIPKDVFFVLGENTAESIDSRDFGFLPLNRIEGMVVSKGKE